jgi:hypothetical protein
MLCHWHRMHNKIFEQLRWVKIICKTTMLCKKMHAVSMTLHSRCIWGHWHHMHGACGVIDPASKIWHHMHDWRTIRTILAALPLKKYINFKRLPDKKFSCMRFHWHLMIDFCVQKSILSQQIRSRIQKGFRPVNYEPRAHSLDLRRYLVCRCVLRSFVNT